MLYNGLWKVVGEPALPAKRPADEANITNLDLHTSKKSKTSKQDKLNAQTPEKNGMYPQS
jgi:hypothetical protein